MALNAFFKAINALFKAPFKRHLQQILVLFPNSLKCVIFLTWIKNNCALKIE